MSGLSCSTMPEAITLNTLTDPTQVGIYLSTSPKTISFRSGPRKGESELEPSTPLGHCRHAERGEPANLVCFMQSA